MAESFYKSLDIGKDVVATRTLLHEAIPLTGTIVSVRMEQITSRIMPTGCSSQYTTILILVHQQIMFLTLPRS